MPEETQKITAENTRKNEIAKAQEKYKTACIEYDRTIRTKVNSEQIEQHILNCQKALAAKRYAAAVLDAVKYNKPVPSEENLAETKILKE